jgi:hypothetical protein
MKVGKGGRARYKAVAMELPQNKSASSVLNNVDNQPAQSTSIFPPSAPGQDEEMGIFQSIDEVGINTPKRTGKVCPIAFLALQSNLGFQKQSDYMKLWLEEKRPAYLQRILQMKAGPQVDTRNAGKLSLLPCPKCNLGRPVWRCLDCSDKSAVCVLCCRNIHKFDVLHRIEKWNGRFYQAGALWQVGVKVYMGHNGHPCPRSVEALAGLSEQIFGRMQPNNENNLADVALHFGKTKMEVLQIVSDVLETNTSAMTGHQADVVVALAEKSGMGISDFLSCLTSSLSFKAEEDSEELQTKSDQMAAEAEGSDDHASDPQGYMEDDIGRDDDWEDEDDRPAKGDLPRFLPRPPTMDGAGNAFITLVHTNGFHSLPVVWCACPNHLEDRDLQMLDLHFYPASYDRIKTVFTFACLDEHRFEYLECKSSHYQFHNKLRRITCPSHPDLAPNRYSELCRVARQWRNMKYRKWHWLLDNLNAKRGEMALFCAACPQPGVNLEAGWEAEQDENP